MEQQKKIREIEEQFREVVQMQKRYIYALHNIEKLMLQKKEKELYAESFEQIEQFAGYVYNVRQNYCGRGLDWPEEYIFAFAKSILDYIQKEKYEEARALIPALVDYIAKSNEELEEILATGLYDVDLGTMKYKKETDISRIENKEQMIQALDPDTMNPLEYFFFMENHNVMTKWTQYFEVYHKHFERFRNKPVTILEIGVWGGGSLQMWKKYFGEECRIIGIDIMEECKNYEEEQIKIYIGSQEDRTFLQKIKRENPEIDIIIDDGGHTMNQQITTFEELYPHLKENGVYLCEDLQTSYWPKYGGGYNKPDSFIEYSKNFIDGMNARYSLSSDLKINDLTKTIRSVHYYDAMIVLEKGKHKPAFVL